MRSASGLGRWALLFGVSFGLGCVRPSQQSEPVSDAPSKLANFDSFAIKVGQGTLDVHVQHSPHRLELAEYRAWAERSAQTVSAYFGEFPVPQLDVKIMTRGNGGLGWGQHWDGKRIQVWAGGSTTGADLKQDWVMIHEMLHAGFPDLDGRHRWMQEGLSTYLEPIVRAQAGDLPATEVWAKLHRNLHFGLPKVGDRGLDNTPTWGRVYWGGTLYWLLVDVEIRSRTNNAKSLRDAILAIHKQGGDGRVTWSTAHVVDIADRGCGVDSASEIYASMATSPGNVDLEQLWRDLGVTKNGEREVVLDEAAPLAHIRRAITATP